MARTTSRRTSCCSVIAASSSERSFYYEKLVGIRVRDGEMIMPVTKPASCAQMQVN